MSDENDADQADLVIDRCMNPAIAVASSGNHYPGSGEDCTTGVAPDKYLNVDDVDDVLPT